MRNHFTFPRGSQAISSAFATILLLITWIILAPTQVGGLASYVIVYGSSMEPNFHIGDLVIAQKQPIYQIGDAVVYQNLELQGFVFHRIISESAGHFTLQGDNNPWVDTYQPSKEEVVGKLWLHIPRGGMVMQKVRTPWVMALVAALLGILVASSFQGDKVRGKKNMNKQTIQQWISSLGQKTRSWFAQLSQPESGSSSTPGQPGTWEGSFYLLGLILFLSLLIGLISFSKPTSRIVPDDIQIQHLGIFSYLASAPQSVYDSNAIKSGDPIFPRLTCTVDVSLQYTLIAPGASNITGSYQLTAVIREQNSGWERQIPLQEKTSFSGTSFGTTAKLDLCKIESLTQSMEQETEFHPGSYTLSVLPSVQLNGELPGRAMEGRFDSGLTFTYDHVHFFLTQEKDAENPLSITATETLSSTHTEVNTVAFLGAQLAIPVLRWAAVLGLIASLAGLFVLGSRLKSMSQNDQAGYFRVKYDTLIVDVQNNAWQAGSMLTSVTSIDALAKLAERYNAIILHVEQDHAHEYFVQAGDTTYTYSLQKNITGTTVPTNEAKDVL